MKQAAKLAPLDGARFLKAREVMALLGYTDRASFWLAVKASGLPFIRLSPRRTVFEESAVREFLDRRTVGKAV